ncbi:MAG: CRISPR-associated DxTHG motif protein [Bacteroidetes bacterium]|jgi:CRISPR-associated DxTHG motif protein|nr:CRISPR-associated DxTHG motif protein [Bacteroidota bacterium]
MRLVSFLGTSDYQPTTYTLPDGNTCQSPYVQEALLRYYEPSSVVVLVTPAARARHADALTRQLAASGVTPHFKAIETPVSEAAQWALFDVLSEALQGTDRAMLDITHGFRSAPLVGVAAALYLEKLAGVTVDPIVYGHRAYDSDVGRVVELGSFLSLIKLTYGAHIFETTGDARPLQEELKQDTDSEMATIVHQLGHMSEALHLLQGPALKEAATNLNHGLHRPAPTKPKHRARHAILAHTNEAFAGFRNQHDLQVQLQQVRYYTERRAWPSALIAVVELIISTVCKATGRSPRRKSHRKEARQQLNRQHGTADPLPFDSRLQTHYSRLNDYRNRIAHNAEGFHIKNDVQALSRDIEKALTAFLKEADDLLQIDEH